MAYGVLALLFALPLAAADIENWSGVELELVSTNRWILRTRGEIRTADAFRQVLNVRGIADVRYSVAPKFSLVGRFDYVEGKTRIGWEEASRVGGGFELPFRGESRTFTARTFVEHNWLPRGQTYDRFRERFALRWTRVPLKPQVMAEVLADSQGWAAMRPSFTVLVPVAQYVELDMGYHFEFRPGRLGGNRQMVYTYLRFRRHPR